MRGSDDGTAGVDSGASIWVFNSLVVTLDLACNPALSDLGIMTGIGMRMRIEITFFLSFGVISVNLASS
jgi:hypothetical protein